MKDSFCSFCGHSFGDAVYPKVCKSCSKWTHNHPRPVAVGLIPVRDSLLVVRRAFEPRKGLLNLPAGYIEVGESWNVACAREILEETSLEIDPDDIDLFGIETPPAGLLMFFGLAPRHDHLDLSTLTYDVEVTEITLYPNKNPPEELAFPTHNTAAMAYFSRLWPR